MGLSVDDIVSTTANDEYIEHAAYDPAARRERYLRTRRLKGRQPNPPSPNANAHTTANSTLSTVSRDKQSGANAAVTAAMQAESTARQIAAIKGRLSVLKTKLNELLAKQRAANGGSKTTSSTTSSTTKSTASTTKTASTTTNKPAPPKTAQQKQAAKESLKKAREVRAKEQKAAGPSLTEQIATTRAAISKVEGQLRVVEERAQTQTASNGR